MPKWLILLILFMPLASASWYTSGDSITLGNEVFSIYVNPSGSNVFFEGTNGFIVSINESYAHNGYTVSYTEFTSATDATKPSGVYLQAYLTFTEDVMQISASVSASNVSPFLQDYIDISAVMSNEANVTITNATLLVPIPSNAQVSSVVGCTLGSKQGAPVLSVSATLAKGQAKTCSAKLKYTSTLTHALVAQVTYNDKVAKQVTSSIVEISPRSVVNLAFVVPSIYKTNSSTLSLVVTSLTSTKIPISITFSPTALDITRVTDFTKQGTMLKYSKSQSGTDNASATFTAKDNGTFSWPVTLSYTYKGKPFVEQSFLNMTILDEIVVVNVTAPDAIVPKNYDEALTLVANTSTSVSLSGLYTYTADITNWINESITLKSVSVLVGDIEYPIIQDKTLDYLGIYRVQPITYTAPESGSSFAIVLSVIYLANGTEYTTSDTQSLTLVAPSALTFEVSTSNATVGLFDSATMSASVTNPDTTSREHLRVETTIDPPTFLSSGILNRAFTLVPSQELEVLNYDLFFLGTGVYSINTSFYENDVLVHQASTSVTVDSSLDTLDIDVTMPSELSLGEIGSFLVTITNNGSTPLTIDSLSFINESTSYWIEPFSAYYLLPSLSVTLEGKVRFLKLDSQLPILALRTGDDATLYTAVDSVTLVNTTITGPSVSAKRTVYLDGSLQSFVLVSVESQGVDTITYDVTYPTNGSLLINTTLTENNIYYEYAGINFSHPITDEPSVQLPTVQLLPQNGEPVIPQEEGDLTSDTQAESDVAQPDVGTVVIEVQSPKKTSSLLIIGSFLLVVFGAVGYLVIRSRQKSTKNPESKMQISTKAISETGNKQLSHGVETLHKNWQHISSLFPRIAMYVRIPKNNKSVPTSNAIPTEGSTLANAFKRDVQSTQNMQNAAIRAKNDSTTSTSGTSANTDPLAPHNPIKEKLAQSRAHLDLLKKRFGK